MSKFLGAGYQSTLSNRMAVKLGIYEAFVIQKVHYWLTSSRHIIDGRKWVYNSYVEWQKQLEFISLSTIKRTFLALEKQGILLSANFNRMKMDKTKWYTINYDKLEEFNFLKEEDWLHIYDDENDEEQIIQQIELDNSKDSTEAAIGSAGDNGCTSGTQPIPKSTSKITNKNTTYIKLVSEVIHYLNEKTNSHYRASNPQTIRLINNRGQEGYELKDFQTVIDKKAAEWKNDRYWSRYLRPETLFGSKFETYLNQKYVKKEMSIEDFDLED